MAYTTRARLAKNTPYLHEVLVSLRKLSATISEFRGPKLPRVFLSHSHSDTELIQYAEYLLMTQGAEIYIDHRDDTLPATPSAETAAMLKNQISDCDRFVMLASDMGRASKWVPWELGYADGRKELNNIAILPVQSKLGDWTGSEYVGLYRTLQINFSGEWFVVDPGGNVYTSQTLRDWLKAP